MPTATGDRTPAEMAANRARREAFEQRPESRARVEADRARTPRSER